MLHDDAPVYHGVTPLTMVIVSVIKKKGGCSDAKGIRYPASSLHVFVKVVVLFK